MSPSEPKTYTCQDFALAMGLGPRKFMDAMRAGTIPAPLNPNAKKVDQFRWAFGTVHAFLSGSYKGPMLAGESVPVRQQSAKAAPKPPKAPRAAKAATAPNNEREGRENSARALFDLLGIGDGEVTRELQIVKHSDGSVTLKPSVSPKN